MATIFFCIHPMTGSINATIKIANNLRSQGHKIYYLGVEDCDKYLKPQKLDLIPVYKNWFPKEESNGNSKVFSSWIDKINFARQFSSLFKKFLNTLISGADKEIFDIFKKYNPDLIIVLTTEFDSIIWTLLAHKANIKCIYLSSILNHSENSVVPPMSSTIIPKNTLLSKIMIMLSWKVFFVKRWLFEMYLSMLGIGVNFNYIVKKLSSSYDYPKELINTKTDLLAPVIKIPELVLWPKLFDFKGYTESDRYYVEPSIDLERIEVEFPWNEIKEGNELVLCALGSLSSRKKKEYINFYQTIIDASHYFSDWQWVIAIGESLSISEFKNIPPNVMVVNQAPQISLLKKAKFMINHGGANSVKECIFLAVPMIMYPLEFDHYGNAAKAVYHGLGLKGDIKKINVSSLKNLITEIDGNLYYREQVGLMQKEFNMLEINKPSLGIINNIISL